MSDYKWSYSRPYCLGLGKVFGNESIYRNSDMQFAKETADYLFGAIKLTENYKNGGGIKSGERHDERVINTHDFVLQLNYRFVADMPDRITSSEVSLQLSSATGPVRHGARYSAVDFSEPSSVSVTRETFGNLSYVLDSVYFDPYGTLAGFGWRDYSYDAKSGSFDTKLSYRGVQLRRVYNDFKFMNSNFETKTRLVGFRTTKSYEWSSLLTSIQPIYVSID